MELENLLVLTAACFQDTFHNARVWKVPSTQLTLSYKHSFRNLAWKNLLQLQHSPVGGRADVKCQKFYRKHTPKPTDRPECLIAHNNHQA